MVNEFSVAVFYNNDTYEYVCRFVGPETAVKAAHQLTHSVGAKFGFVQRVIITDGGDCTNFEWTYEDGITYPPRNESHDQTQTAH